LHILEGGFADEAVVTDALDVKQTSVGRKADLAQLFEIFDASADGEVAGVIDRRFGSKCLRSDQTNRRKGGSWSRLPNAKVQACW
jgi:hypothetical protein